MKKNTGEKVAVYIAGPLYTPGDRFFLEQIDFLCKDTGLKTYLPHRDAGLAPADGSVTIPFFERDAHGIDDSDIIIAVLNGSEVDSGTAWEIGYAYARQRLLLGVYDDTRIDNPNAALNLMITSSTRIFASLTALKNELVSMKGISRSAIKARNILFYNDVPIMIKKILSLPLNMKATTPETFGYENAVLCCLDAVLSINRQYKSFVVPRIVEFQKKFALVTTLKDFEEMLSKCSPEKFGREYLSYRDPDRMILLRRTVRKLLTIVKEMPQGIGEMDALRQWAHMSGVHGYRTLNVKGIGLATYQYLRMLLGVSTVKPDLHITKFVKETLGKRITPIDSIFLIETVASRLGMPATTLDHALWKFSSEKTI